MTVSRLKHKPDRVVIKNGEGSGTLISTGLLSCRCIECDQEFYSPSNLVRFCPCCGRDGVEKQWTRPQVVLVPEKESPFLAYGQHDDDEEGTR